MFVLRTQVLSLSVLFVKKYISESLILVSFGGELMQLMFQIDLTYDLKSHHTLSFYFSIFHLGMQDMRTQTQKCIIKFIKPYAHFWLNNNVCKAIKIEL